MGILFDGEMPCVGGGYMPNSVGHARILSGCSEHMNEVGKFPRIAMTFLAFYAAISFG